MMPELLKKMNYKGQSPVVVLQAPDDFAERFAATIAPAQVATALSEIENSSFMLAFVTLQEQVDTFAPQLSNLLEGDGAIWFAYPKGSSKRYTCDFNRDTGWGIMGALGFEPVRMVAVDADWSALRFRRVEYIKTMTRSFAMTEAGKEKVQGSKV